MDALNYNAEKQYLAGEREAEIAELRNDPSFYETLAIATPITVIAPERDALVDQKRRG